MYDIVYVSYNSAKWIEKCFASYDKLNYDLTKLNIFVVDNSSTDNTLELLKKEKEKRDKQFGSFEIIAEKRNWGFGKANNIGFARGSSEVVCFLNIDTEVFPDTFQALDAEVQISDESVGLWEFRQFPYEHPKMYDALTGEVNWASGAAFATLRKVYAEVKGFDEKLFLYAEDVDLSWRIRSAGYRLIYVPKVKITHYSYESAGEVKPNQYVYGLVNNLLLRYRYGGVRKILWGHFHLLSLLFRPEAFAGSKGMLMKQYWKHFRLFAYFRQHGKYRKGGKSVGRFYGWDYDQIRDGAFYNNFLLERKPLVSIIVRTCGRPAVLRETLISLRRQTYENIEIVVVEDGPAKAEKMIREEFADLNILYHATDQNVGRSKAGNLAMELAHGEYLNFLDDDDLFYADHVEVLVANLEKSGMQAAYATSYETPVIVSSKDPYEYEVLSYLGIHKQEFNRAMLCHHNYIPIQCIMFSKELFLKYGGLDETTDALEDWDLWVRYSLHTDFAFVFKTTSIYRVPAQREVNAKRQKALDDALVYMREKHKGYQQKISVYEMAQMYERM